MIVIAVANANVPVPDKSAAKKLLLAVTTAVAEWLGVWCTEQRIASSNPALLTDLFFFLSLKIFLVGHGTGMSATAYNYYPSCMHKGKSNLFLFRFCLGV